MTPNTFLWRFINSTTYTVTSFVVFAARFAFFSVLFGALRLLVFFLNLLFLKKISSKLIFSWIGIIRKCFLNKGLCFRFLCSELQTRRFFLYGAFLRFCIIIRPVRFPNRKMLSAFCSVLCAASIPVFSCSVSLTFECALFNTVIPAISAAFFTGERWYISDWGLISFSNFRRVLAFFFFSS